MGLLYLYSETTHQVWGRFTPKGKWVKSNCLLTKLAKLAKIELYHKVIQALQSKGLIMQVVNIHEAKTNLSKLIEKTSKGEEVIIAKAGKPVAKLSSYKKPLKPRKPGLWKGKVWVADNFDDEDEEINKLFYEGDI